MEKEKWTIEDERKRDRLQVLFLAFRYGLSGAVSIPYVVTLPILSLINEIPDVWKRKMIAEIETAIEDGLNSMRPEEDVKIWRNFIKELKEAECSK